MISFETFEQNLREMLLHLYDPVYRPPEGLRQVLGVPREQGVEAVREVVLAAVEELKPSERVPLSARSWRIYGMLRYRFVEDLPQESAAEKLGITARHLRRDLVEAVHAMALHLWEKQAVRAVGGDYTRTGVGAAYPGAASPAEDSAAGEGAAGGPRPSDSANLWLAQLRRELDALQETASGAAANLNETVAAVLRLGAHLTERRGITLRAGPVAPNLVAAIHPSALRQILISIVDQLARSMENGKIEIEVEPLDGQLRLCLTASPVSEAALGQLALIREFLSDADGSFEVTMRKGEAHLALNLLAVDRCVLVVDDNADIVHLYRRYLAGTRYYIQHINQGQAIFDSIEMCHPHVVVLDVMLPDVDGWDLLTRLHENPTTRALPVVICSVMREQELALALGARGYIAKPVQRGEFIAALDNAASANLQAQD